MKHIAMGVALVLAVWCGYQYRDSRQRPPPVYIIKAEPIPAQQISNCKRALEVCKKEWRNKKG